MITCERERERERKREEEREKERESLSLCVCVWERECVWCEECEQAYAQQNVFSGVHLSTILTDPLRHR